MACHSAQVSKTPAASMRRSFTLPSRPSDSIGVSRRDTTTTPNSQIETLFTHPSVRIVSFTAPPRSSAGLDSNASSGDQDIGTLPWSSCLERLVGVGPMSLYRGPGGVAFLSCGKVMHAILPKSQCWCVDDASRNFVLQIRRPQYYRIELPLPELENSRVSDTLRDVLGTILLFEKTPCPFERGFTVELPEPPVTPPKKRPWRPVQRAEEPTENTPSPEATPKPTTKPENATPRFPTMPIKSSGHISHSNTTDEAGAAPRIISQQSTLSLLPEEGSARLAEVFRVGRSFTAPPLTVVTSSLPETVRTASPCGRSVSINSSSSDCSSSLNSFHTVQSWHSPITPPPTLPEEPRMESSEPNFHPHEMMFLQRYPSQIRETSEMTVTPAASRVWEVTSSSSDESIEQYQDYSRPLSKVPTAIGDLEENVDMDNLENPATPGNGHQSITVGKPRRRVLSPLPSAANLFSPSPRSSHLQTSRHLPTAIIQKACEILRSPPSHLINLMLDIANKIVAGEWRRMIFGTGEDIYKIIGQWDYQESENSLDEWEEDDYGNNIGGKQESGADPPQHPPQEGIGKSWEVE